VHGQRFILPDNDHVMLNTQTVSLSVLPGLEIRHVMDLWIFWESMCPRLIFSMLEAFDFSFRLHASGIMESVCIFRLHAWKK
jgi:hypothetical protein